MYPSVSWSRLFQQRLFGPGRLIEIDALSHYRKYSDILEIDDVPMEERDEVARRVADWVLDTIESAS